MSEQHFNLLTEPWLKVIDADHQEKEVSLTELFKNAKNYLRLAGEMQAQDLAILRFLLAILMTVYSRFNAEDEPYRWLTVDSKTFLVSDPDQDEYEDCGDDDFLETWKKLYQRGCFSQVLFDYLQAYSDRFDFFDDKRPFYQLNKEDYNIWVAENKSIKPGKTSGTGTVAVKQINRTISESSNTPAIFSPKDRVYKNQITLSELIRWIICYQNFTGATDRTKVKSNKKFSVSSGWLYKLNPVYAQGKTLFETLMLNLAFNTKNNLVQKPIWEYDSPVSYVKHLLSSRHPDNIAELYTNWSRIMHVEFVDNSPVIYVAGLPRIDVSDAFIEPMTTWTYDKRSNHKRPQTRDIKHLDMYMWRDFGSYARTRDDETSTHAYLTGEIFWLSKLKKKDLITVNQQLSLRSVAVVSDGNGSSQLPAVEISENMQIRAGVLFDKDQNKRQFWPGRIQDTIEVTQKVGEKVYSLGCDVGKLIDSDKVKTFASQLSSGFYDSLNYPFYSWLASLSNDDNRDEKIKSWKQTVKNIAFRLSDNLLQRAGTQEIKGIQKDDNIENIFTVCSKFRANIYKLLV